MARRSSGGGVHAGKEGGELVPVRGLLRAPRLLDPAVVAGGLLEVGWRATREEARVLAAVLTRALEKMREKGKWDPGCWWCVGLSGCEE